MCIKVALALKVSITRLAVVMYKALYIVLLQPILTLEYFATKTTIVVMISIMVHKFIIIVEMLFTILAIVMIWALDPVFFQALKGDKVQTTILAKIVMGTIPFMGI